MPPDNRPTAPAVQLDAGVARRVRTPPTRLHRRQHEQLRQYQRRHLRSRFAGTHPRSAIRLRHRTVWNFTIHPNLTPGASYSVRLDFAELYFTSAGQRIFNVSINGSQVLSNFDIVAAAGGRIRRSPKSSPPREHQREHHRRFTSIINNAKVSAISITPTGAAPVNSPPAIATNPSNQTVAAGQSASFTAAVSGNRRPRFNGR